MATVVSAGRTRLAAASVAAALAAAGPLAAGSLVAQAADDAPRVLEVGEGRPYSTVGAALRAADLGDTVRVGPGVYRERLRIERAVALVGEGWPVVDGGGGGHVIEATAPVSIRGFHVRGSGTRVDTEDAGVMVRAGPSRIEGNRIDDVLYGIYLKDAPRSVVRGNRIEGKPLPPPRRGDGIRLWHSSGSRILDNEVVRTRDVVIYFSDGLRVAGNEVREGRYGLHYMYSDDNLFERNRFVGNQVGAFLMYSREIRLRENVFADAEGASGMGLGLKDADAIEVVDNLLLGNAVGIYLDNSPSAREATNRFDENLLALNGVGVRLLPSVRGNVFRGNAFVGNERPAEVSGGTRPGQVEQNDWRANHWSSYAGFDQDDDGVGDTPYVHARIADELLARYPELRIFARSPALRMLDLLARFFPLIEPAPVVVDPAPLAAAPALVRWQEAPPAPIAGLEQGAPRAAGIAWTALLVVAAVAGTRLARRPAPDGGSAGGERAGIRRAEERAA